MADAEGYVSSTFYVQFAPEYTDDSRRRVWRLIPKACTQNRPARPRGAVSTQLVKLTVRIPESVFLPLEPEAVITVQLGQSAELRVDARAEDVELSEQSVSTDEGD